jgi:hypothetical protein
MYNEPWGLVNTAVSSHKKAMDAIEILKEKLVGNFYSRFSAGDTFDLYFDQFWLTSQNVVASEEKQLNGILSSEYQPANEAIDKEDIAKIVVISSTLRKKITEVSLSADSTLKLVFENSVYLQFPTDTEIADWHWAINEKGNDPYLGCIVGCFNPGEVQVGSC